MNKIFSCIITQISCHGKRRCCLFLVLGLGSRNLCFQPKNVKVVPNLQVHQRPLKYENISFENYVIAELRKIQHTWVHSCPYHANWATRNYNNLEEICTSFFYYLNVKKHNHYCTSQSRISGRNLTYISQRILAYFCLCIIFACCY